MTVCEPLRGLIPNSTVRPASLADVPAVTALMQQVATDMIGEPDATPSEVRDDLIMPRFEMSTDTALVIADEKAVVYAQAHDEHDERAFVDVFIDPTLDDELFAKVADGAVAGALARVREAMTIRGGKNSMVGTGLYQGERRMVAAYQRAGLMRSHVYWRMSKALSTDVEIDVCMPVGVTIRSVDPDDQEVMIAALSLENETFREHHGHVDKNITDFADSWRNTSRYDRGAWWFAYLDGELVGLCLGDEGKVEKNAGYVCTLGVVKKARGRGVAKALLLTSFSEYQRRGRSAVELGVDSANETGATRLYESVGMSTKIVIDSMEMPISV